HSVYRSPSFSSLHGYNSRKMEATPIPDPSASKRVCFYKSGDPKFGGHRMVVNGRTFKTFDALLDALSKKVPLPFGVRTISTPRGTHSVRGLEDLHDGGSYVCSDRRRVKPLNLDVVHRRKVPWNTTRPPSTGRRSYGRRNEGPDRADKIGRRVSVRTPKRLVVVKNRDSTVKRTVLLQKRTAPTFDALLDYLSQVMQFPVLKLYSSDGRRVDGLAALILCSGVIVAAGNEPFRLGNYNTQTSSKYNVHTIAYMSQSGNSDAINKSLNGGIHTHQHPHNGSLETDPDGNHTNMDMETQEPPRSCIMPQDEDIEKSFRVNQDGSMTVEMKVRLTIKEEELLHWTTTLSRSSLNSRTACASRSGTGLSLPDSNNVMDNDSSSSCHDAANEENQPVANGNNVGFGDERACESYPSTESERTKSGFKRNSTPGPHHVRTNTSVESIKTVTESGVRESTIGRHSYTEKTAEAEVTEACCVVRHNTTSSSSSTSNRPVPHPRRTASARDTNKALHPSIQSEVVANVLQLENNGVEITETVMHIYERQGGYDNLAKNEYINENPRSNSASLESREHSGSVDGDVDFTPPSSSPDSKHRPKEVFSLSSEPISPKQRSQSSNESQSKTNPKGTPAKADVKEKKNPARFGPKKKAMNPAGKMKSTPSSSNSEAKQKDSSSKTTNSSSAEKLRDHNAGKKSCTSSESSKKGQKGKETELLQSVKKGRRSDKSSSEKQAISPNIDQVKSHSTKREGKIRERAPRENGFNINIPEKEMARPPMKKNLHNIVQPKQLHGQVKKGLNRQKSLSEKKIASPKPTELSESVSMPVINPSPSEVNQYVEKWLETQMSPDSVPYLEEATIKEPEKEPELPTKVVFQIGGDSESDAVNECQTNTSAHNLSHGDALLTSKSGLLVPLCQEGLTTDNTQRLRGLCVSMPSVRIDPAEQEKTLRMHRSSEAFGPVENKPSSSVSNLLPNPATVNPVLRQLFSSSQCIRRASETENPGNIKKSKSLADFSTQVATVFGTPSRAFISFLSAVTLRESLKGAVAGESHLPRSTSEAMLVMESLQKISTIDDELLQRSSLTDLHNSTSSDLRDRWRDFQVHRERLKSEPLSPKVSEQEFALDVSEPGDMFDMTDIMDELNMPQDLREQISSTIRQTMSFYPEDEESTFIEREKHHSESEEELERFHKENADETKLSQEPDSLSIAEEKENSQLPTEDLNGTIKRQSLCQERNDPISDSKPEVDEVQEMKEAGETDTWEHEDQSKHLENLSEPGLVTDDCGSETSVNAKKEEVERDSLKDGYQERLTELENEVEHGEEFEKVLHKEEVLEETQDEDNNSLKSVKAKRERDEAGEDNIEDDMERWKEEEASTPEVGEDVNKEILEVKSEEEEWCKQGIDEKELDKGQTEPGEFTDSNKGEATGDSSGEMGFTDKENEVDEEDEEPEVVEEKEADSVEDELEKGSPIEKEVAEEDDKGESTDEEGEGDVADKEMGEESCEESDEESCRKDNEEGKDEEDEVDIEAEQQVEGEQSSVEEMEDEVDLEAEQEVEGEQSSDGSKEDEVDLEAEQEVEGEQSSVEEKEDEVDLEAVQEVEGEQSSDGGKEDEVDLEAEQEVQGEQSSDEEKEEEVDLEAEQQVEGVKSSDEEKEDEDEEDAFDLGVRAEETDLNDEKDEPTGKLLIAHADISICEEDNNDNSDNEKANKKTEEETDEAGSLKSCFNESQFEGEKDNASDTAHDLRSEDGGNEEEEENRSQIPTPVEISQELIDFVNSALQSSSLKFTYDILGNVRIEPDQAKVIHTQQMLMTKGREDILYRLKQLPSPNTSDLSDYRPETSVSGGYNTQESIDIVTGSGDELENMSLGNGDPAPGSEMSDQTSQLTDSIPSLKSNSGPGLKTFSSSHSGTASKEDLSYSSAAGSLKADPEVASQVADLNSNGGVLIDKGRWLLKENHLIRKSPPALMGMYDDADSSPGMSPDNTSEDSHQHALTHQHPLAVLSSSDLEEMAKPHRPKCNYYNMPHGSDSDPFLDDLSIKSSKRKASNGKGKGLKVSPTVDTSKTWLKKNGSLSSFASVEFKMQDSRVHPEGDRAAVAPATTPPGGAGHVLLAQDSVDEFRRRCGQYCPIL
uniref:Doublecortin domain-containing protein n=1 Tax=Gadus morhua TaxID=8049 RepID=A0A8C5BTP8_GADMO